MNDNFKELKKNTVLIAIANIGSRLISFILAPLYSFYMSAEQYGIMDLVTTTCYLIVPLICLDIYESTFRFTKDSSCDNKKVLSTSTVVCLYSLPLCLIGVGIYLAVFPFKLSIIISVVYAVLDVFYNNLIQYARGKDKIGTYAFSGVLYSVILLIGNIVFLISLRMELVGWMVSFVLAKALVIVYLIFCLRLWNDFSFKFFDKKLLKTCLKYSLPLMPSASMWWIMNVSDRYILSFYAGVAVTGIYAVATKLPTVLTVCGEIFYKAWETTAIDSSGDAERDVFYSDIFNDYFSLLSLGVLGILVVLKPMILLLFASEFSSAWVCSSVLVIGVLIHALAGNIGILYIVFKDTKGALITSFIGAVCNIALNFIFIPRFGMIAAACTTFFSYFVVLIIRWFDIKKFVKIAFYPKKGIATVLLIALQFALYYVDGPVSFALRFFVLLLCLVLNRSVILKILKR